MKIKQSEALDNIILQLGVAQEGLEILSELIIDSKIDGGVKEAMEISVESIFRKINNALFFLNNMEVIE